MMNTQNIVRVIVRSGGLVLVAATLTLAAGCTSGEVPSPGEGTSPGEPVATATEASSTPPPSEPSNPASSDSSESDSFANAGWVLFAALALLFVVTLIAIVASRRREPALAPRSERQPPPRAS